MNDLGAVVLAGGASSRLGRDKSSLPAPEGTYLRRIVGILGELAGEIVVVGPATGPLPDPGPAPRGVALCVVRDAVTGAGPLEGVRAGLASLRAPIAYVTSNDVPLLTSTLVARTVDALRGAPDAAIAVAVTEGRPHPLAMALRRERVLAEATRLRARGNAGPVALLDALPHVRVPADDVREALYDVDTPADLVAVTALLATPSSRASLGAPEGVPSGLDPGYPAMTTPTHDETAPESLELDAAERGDVRGLKLAFWLGIVVGVVHGAPKYGVFSMFTVALAGLMIITFVGIYAAYVALAPARPVR